jgi:hypothetical protein
VTQLAPAAALLAMSVPFTMATAFRMFPPRQLES